eukprot:gene8770-9504_t
MDESRARAFEADATTKKPIDEQVQLLFTFIQQHEQQLEKIHELNCHELLQRNTKRHQHPTITLLNDSQERVAPQELIPNNIQENLRKTLLVLIYLGEEITQLKEIAELKFYKPLCLFGNLPVENWDNRKDANSDDNKASSNHQYTPLVNTEHIGVKEKMLGNFLPFLQELSNFIERCHLVVLNLIQQLSALYHPNNTLYRSLLEKTNLMSVLFSLSEILTVLITLDTIISQNDNLLSAWSAYKSMIAFSRSDPQSFGTSTEIIIQFEALLVSLDSKVLSGEIFKNCIEQNFEEVKLNVLDEADGITSTPTIIHVRENDKFIENFLLNGLKLMIENTLSIIGTNVELNERLTIVGSIGIYALYRSLMPRRQQPDMKLHRSICSAMSSLLHPIQFKIEGLRNLDLNKSYLLSVTKTLIYLLKTTDYFTPCRQAMLSVLLEILISSNNTSIRSDKDASRLQTLGNKLIALSNLQKEITSSLSTSFIFFHTSVLPTVVKSIYSLPTEVNRLPYIYRIFEDGGESALQYILYEKEEKKKEYYYDNYCQYLINILNNEIIKPLCRDIENDLRYHIHTKHLDHMISLNPKTENMKILKPFLDLLPLYILNRIISIKEEVTHYLDYNFYNLTTIALHDWRTYSEMRSLAYEKYNISLMDNYLPMGSLDQGLDILQIMRNIHVFVSRFNYNLNLQQFIEYRPDKASKHINTIKIQSIAASIRQHGLGILNTTVNFTYQFLSLKFKIFSQFLFDEHIRAQLSKEHRWYRKNKNTAQINNIYPYENAMNIVKEIRKLGVTDNKTYLDQFRILVTEIGNALGYVRMVRSASMYYCSEAVKYLPDFDDIIEFEKYVGSEGLTADENHGKEMKGANLSSETIRAAKNLDNVIKTLVKNFGEGSDYFKVLVNVFQSVLSSNDQDHLKYFYIIVPSMCISWIEASIAAKDNMYKSGRGTSAKEMYFTDDGFAMGVAYILAILKLM